MTWSVRLRRLLPVWALALALASCVVTDPAPEAPSSAADAAGGYEAFQLLLQEWANAVADDAVDRALSLYTANARVRLEYLAQGPELRPALAEWLPRVSSVVMGPADYDISGNLAYGVMRVLVVPADGGRREAGFMTIIARWTSGRWWIRAQYLSLSTLG